jgi:hypothetical protein
MVERLVCERARIDAEVSRLATTRDRLDHIITETRRNISAGRADRRANGAGRRRSGSAPRRSPP